MSDAEADGYYWAKIKHTGEIEIVEIMGGAVLRTGEEQIMELDQVTVIERVAPPK